MVDKVFRVAVISTGGVGSIAVPAVARRDDFDLVGVWVHSPAKVGVDAGELVGMGPIGLPATGDLDEIISLAPDCAVYTATSDELDAAAVRDYVRLLEAGINVVTTNTPGMMYPDGWIPELVDQVRTAAIKGGATAYTSGIEPGFAGDQLVVVLSTLSKTIRSARAQEIFDYSDYPNTHMMFDVMGFGKPMDYTPILAYDGVQQFVWGPPIRLVAHALGITLDEIAESFERESTPRELTVAAGVIPAGTCGAIRTETMGMVDGKAVIIIEHVNRMAPDIAPQWPTAPNGTYRILIDGEPSMTCDLQLGTPETASVDGMVATAMRVVNAIPYVVEASPGIATSLDMPLTAPRYPLES